MISDLTVTQQQVLAAIDRQYRKRDEIAERARPSGWNGSLDGLNQTLGSLIRRGLVERTKLRGGVHFQLTDKGVVAARTYRAHA